MRLNKPGEPRTMCKECKKNWESHKKLGPNKSSTTASAYSRCVPCLSNPSRSQLIGGHPYPSKPASHLEFNEIPPTLLRLLLTSENFGQQLVQERLKTAKQKLRSWTIASSYLIRKGRRIIVTSTETAYNLQNCLSGSS